MHLYHPLKIPVACKGRLSFAKPISFVAAAAVDVVIVAAAVVVVIVVLLLRCITVATAAVVVVAAFAVFSAFDYYHNYIDIGEERKIIPLNSEIST